MCILPVAKLSKSLSYVIMLNMADFVIKLAVFTA